MTDADATVMIAQLRRFDGEPAAFWPLFLRCVRQVCACERATLGIRVRKPDPSGDGVVESWRALASDPRGGAQLPEAQLLGLALAEGIAKDDRWLAFAIGGEEVGEGVIALERGSETVGLPLEAIVALLGAIPETAS